MVRGNTDWRERVCRETARMSWPNRMVGGQRSPLINNGNVTTKRLIETFFVNDFGLEDLPTEHATQEDFDNWHWERVRGLAHQLMENGRRGNPDNNIEAISAKFVNTFFHQLMKYDDFRYLWDFLHLPLDRRVFAELKKRNFKYQNSINGIIKIIRCKSPYEINKKDYNDIQKSLWSLTEEMNKRDEWGRKLTSRIELNLLWVELIT